MWHLDSEVLRISLKHSGSLLEGGVNLADVDEQDGNAIVSNIFGGNTDSVIKTLGSKSKTGDESLVSQLLPMLSPIVMAYLSQQFLGKKDTGSAKSSGGGLGDLLGGILGGGNKSGGGLGDILGGLLGGGKRSGGGLGDLLGGILGGKN